MFLDCEGCFTCVVFFNREAELSTQQWIQEDNPNMSLEDFILQAENT